MDPVSSVRVNHVSLNDGGGGRIHTGDQDSVKAVIGDDVIHLSGTGSNVNVTTSGDFDTVEPVVRDVVQRPGSAHKSIV